MSTPSTFRLPTLFRTITTVALALVLASAATLPATAAGPVVPAGPAVYGSISGDIRQVAPSGPAADVAVVAIDTAGAFAGTVLSDAAGHYKIPSLLPGTYAVRFDWDGPATYVSEYWSHKTILASANRITVAAGQDITGKDVTLDGRAPATGSVTGTVTPRPLAGAPVSVTAYPVSSTSASGRATTAADGTYSLASLVAGTYRIRFVPPVNTLYAAQWLGGGTTPASSGTVTVAGNQTVAGVDATLTTGASLRGTVTGRAGGIDLPLAGVEVLATTPGEEGRTELFFDVTAGDGTFMIRGLAAGAYTLSFDDSGAASPRGDADKYATEFWNDQPMAETAQAIVLATKQAATSLNPILALRSAAEPLPGAPTPTVKGTAAVGVRLIGNVGTWPNPADSYAYRWLRDGTVIGGSKYTTYTVQASDVGHNLTFIVLGYRAGYPVTTKPSATISVVALDPSIPTVLGSRQVGRDLWVAPGTWPAGTALSYRWIKNGTPIPGATSRVYTVVKPDAGKVITVDVTGTAGGTALTTHSRAIAVLRTFTGVTAPTVSGTRAVGITLTATPGAWQPVPVGFTYQWLRDGIPIAGATASSYRLVAADSPTSIRVSTTGTRYAYTSATRTSAAAYIG